MICCCRWILYLIPLYVMNWHCKIIEAVFIKFFFSILWPNLQSTHHSTHLPTPSAKGGRKPEYHEEVAGLSSTSPELFTDWVRQANISQQECNFPCRRALESCWATERYPEGYHRLERTDERPVQPAESASPWGLFNWPFGVVMHNWALHMKSHLHRYIFKARPIVFFRWHITDEKSCIKTVQYTW